MAEEQILIVEDERAVARGLEYALTREGFTVWRADTGQRALELAHSRSPHLVVLDIRLPDMSGFDVCRQLRGAGKHMPILMLTARDEEVDKVLGLELGADDYVVKPYRSRFLLLSWLCLLASNGPCSFRTKNGSSPWSSCLPRRRSPTCAGGRACGGAVSGSTPSRTAKPLNRRHS